MAGGGCGCGGGDGGGEGGNCMWDERDGGSLCGVVDGSEVVDEHGYCVGVFGIGRR